MSAAADLADYLAAAPAFSWRSNHCGHHAAGWVKRRTARDPLTGLHTAGRRAALAVVREHGDLSGVVTALTGWQPVPHLTAQAGDLVMIPTDSAIGGALVTAAKTN